jgi:hypothetical protein
VLHLCTSADAACRGVPCSARPLGVWGVGWGTGPPERACIATLRVHVRLCPFVPQASGTCCDALTESTDCGGITPLCDGIATVIGGPATCVAPPVCTGGEARERGEV